MVTEVAVPKRYDSLDLFVRRTAILMCELLSDATLEST
jgi:hypothetical protein